MGLNGIRAARRGLGVALLATAYLPLHRLLDPAATGPAGAATRAAGEAVQQMVLLGSIVVVALATVLTWLAPSDGIRRALALAAARLSAPAPRAFAVGLGLTTGLLGMAVSLWVLEGRPTLADEMAQLLHARAVAEGSLSLALPEPRAAWIVQNGIVTGGGWASIYPPGHTLILAAGFLLGAPWLMGPVLLGVMSAATARVLETLIPERSVARGAALAAGLCPFLVFLGAGYLNHVSAGAFAATTLWAALRARQGRLGWAVATGMAVGALVCVRPWAGIAISVALLATLWVPAARRWGWRWSATRAAGLLAGGAPFAALLFSWNRVLFASPTRLGYAAAFGPAHGLGFHADPWGNVYGASAAVAYSGSDLLHLGAHLLETPLPATVAVALWLIFATRLPEGGGALLAWALAPILANAFYWHHGLHMGPRFLYEAGPAWAALAVVAVAALARNGPPLPRLVRDGALWAALVSLAGAALLAPGRGRSYRASPAAVAASTLPAPPASHPALVFVHGSWASRVGAKLVAAGMRRDSVETAIRRNDLCDVERYATWREGSQLDPAPELSLVSAPGTPRELVPVELSPGNRIRVRPGVRPPSSCLREAHADRFGSIELEPLLWQASLPHSAGDLVVARDLGPALNARVTVAFPGHQPYMYFDDGGRPRLLPYAEGLALLWEEGLSGAAE